MRPCPPFARVPRRTLRLALTLALLLTALPLAAPRPAAAAACTVTNTTDAAPGSLRAHLADTNCTTIDATGVTGTITLASDLPTVTRTVSVTGPGAATLTIDRNDTSTGVAFQVDAGGTLTLSGLTLTGAGQSVFIFQGGSATVINSTLSGNEEGLYFDHGGNATVTNSTISDNTSAGLFFDGGGNATVTNSTLNSNGDGLNFINGGSATVTSSTLSGNFRGLYFEQGGSATVTNSTLSGNTIGLNFLNGGSAAVTNSTLSGNFRGLSFNGGGSATVTNTLLAKGADPNCVVTSGGTFTNSGHNLADDISCFTNNANSSTVVAVGATGLDPLGLQSNGGPTQTIALTASSPALNAGNNTACAQTGAGKVNAADQRGVGRPQGAICDIGAFESVAAGCAVSSTADSGSGTLRSCLEATEVSTITFNLSGSAPWTIPLASDLPTVTRAISVTGPGPTTASLIVNRNSTTFPATAFPVGAGGTLTLSGLTVAGGYYGITLVATSSATVTNSTFSGNTRGLNLAATSSATVTSSTFHGNTYGLYFGQGGSATVTNSTFHSNGIAGLLFNFSGGSATVTNSTFSGNGFAGLSFAGGGSATLTNTLLATSSNINCYFNPFINTRGTVTNGGHNLDTDTTCGLGSANGNLADTPAGLDPNGLQSNGGPTQTIALLPTSLAINAGNAAVCSQIGAGKVNAVDQRGTVRPQGSGCDIGAYELLGYTLTTGTTGSGAGTVSPASGAYLGEVSVSANAASGSTFTGWTVDGVSQGWANPLTLTMDADHTVVASFASTKSFADVPANRDDATAIRELATRGTIRGYNASSYGPDDGVQRAQMAALIARATGAGPGTPPTTLTPPACLVAGTWDCEDWGNSFTDQSGDPNLWRNAGTLQHYGVALGYQPADCAAKGRAFPCYGPSDAVTSAETITFITRAMVAKGYWVNQPGATHPYPGVPAVFAPFVATYHHYTQGAGGLPAPPANWSGGATRGWFARALWQALNTYWATDGNLPDGRPAGGFAP